MKPRARLSQLFEPLDSGPNESLALLHFAFRAVVAEPDARLAKLGLGRVHHRILFFVARTPELRIVDLLATLNVTKQALHRPLKELVQQKLIQIRVDPNNRRERRVSLTTAGKTLERALSGQQRRAFAVAFRHAGPGAAQGWRAVMRELIRRA